MARYATGDDVKAQGYEGLKDADPNLLDSLAEAASRIFDRLAEAPEDYFAPAPFFPVWEPAHAYELGAQISPGNGRLYTVTTEGVSGDVAPAWTEVTGAIIADGGEGGGGGAGPEVGGLPALAGVEWRDDGPLATPRTFYGEGADLLILPPYLAGSLATVSLPADVAAVSYREVPGGIQRNYLGASSLDLTNPVLWGGLEDYRFRQFRGWPEGAAVTVYARWGFPATPADIRQAVLMIAIHIFRNADAARLAAADLENAAILESIPKTARDIADKWRERGLSYGL